MRFFLLSLALLYAAIPPGLCACQLQSSLLHSLFSWKNASADPAQDDDDDDAPGECHCVGTKQLCNTTPAPRLDGSSGDLVLTLDAPPASMPPTPLPAGASTASDHRAETPLYLTLRALLI